VERGGIAFFEALDDGMFDSAFAAKPLFNLLIRDGHAEGFDLCSLCMCGNGPCKADDGQLQQENPAIY
jgi:hypothetical protein